MLTCSLNCTFLCTGGTWCCLVGRMCGQALLCPILAKVLKMPAKNKVCLFENIGVETDQVHLIALKLS